MFLIIIQNICCQLKKINFEDKLKAGGIPLLIFIAQRILLRHFLQFFKRHIYLVNFPVTGFLPHPETN